MSLNDGRASPKSQILSLQSELARMFLGFRSRWKTLAARAQRRSWPSAHGSGCGKQAGRACAALTGVNVLQTSQHLVQEELMMLRRQVIVSLDDLLAPDATLTVTPSAVLQAPLSKHHQHKPSTTSTWQATLSKGPGTWWRSVSMSSNTT